MSSRERVAARVVEILDGDFLRALAEPVRLEILRLLVVHGASDVASVAASLPQDRSVISRHLKVLEDAGVVRSHKEGRRRVYEVDGPAFVGTLERMAAEARALVTVCCP